MAEIVKCHLRRCSECNSGMMKRSACTYILIYVKFEICFAGSFAVKLELSAIARKTSVISSKLRKSFN